MLKLSLSEFFIRAIPESFLFIFSTYALSKSVINKKRWLISSILMAIAGFIIRLLPINLGVHTILLLIVIIFTSVIINKIDITKSIQASIVAIIIEYICEGINVFIIQFVFKLDLNAIFKNPSLKTIYGIPSTILFAFIVILYYFRLSRRNELKNV